MSRHLAVLVFSVLALGMVAVAATGQSDDAAEAAAAPAADPADPALVERGRYLVEGVTMCGQCHTPRDGAGELQMSHWLKGGPVPTKTPEGFESWAYKAPRIAGLPQHTDEQFVTLMTTGVNRDGKSPLAPMPPFRLTAADALAIAAYLRSLD